MEIEEWKFIDGFGERYQVSNFGRIRSLPRRRCRKSRLLSLTKVGDKGYSDSRYLGVSLSLDTIKCKPRVHRLVAIAFVPNPENKREVNHKNGIKWDNRAENLEWATSLENKIHARDVLGKYKKQHCIVHSH